MSEERLTRLEEKVDALQAEMRAGHAELRAGQEGLGHQMRVLHEQTLDNIKALAPDFDPIRREFKHADAELREDIDRRLTPLEALARTRRRR